jgi:NAD(P)-dependent dehydrogenase (short-subunit alcohol dehydrogenase family)
MNSIHNMINMSGHRALITGATGHIGRIIADTLAELGCDLVLVDLPNSNFQSLEDQISTTKNIQVSCFECDLESESNRIHLIESIRSDALGLSCLINNAAFVGSSNLTGWSVDFENQSIETWRRALEVNLIAPFHLAQGFSYDLRKSTFGNIINISSIYGLFAPDWRLYDDTDMSNPAAYSSSKAGLLQLTRWLSTTLAPSIRVNSISPGGLYRDQPKQFVDRYVERTPLGRMATEDDFRGAIAFLASPLSNYVTGHNLVVDGGWGIW